MYASLRRLLRLLKKELSQTLRDPKMLGIIFFMPVLELFIFGYAVSTDINNIQTAILDEDHSYSSREFIERLRGSGYFVLRRTLEKPSECTEVLDRGEVQFVLRLPPGFGKDLARGSTAVIQTLFDGTDSMSAGIINGYVNQIVREYSQQYLDQRLSRLKPLLPTLPAIKPEIRVWFNPELKSVMFNIPGVLCLILFLVTMMMTALSIVKEKEIGTLEQIIVTPIRPWELILGKTIPYFLVGLIVTALVVSVAWFWFSVIPQGSLLLLMFLICIFLMTSLGMGILISTVSATQQEAVITSFFVLFPMILLSGLIFPISNMPEAVQLITYIIPLRYFLEIVRSIYLKGAGLEYLWPQSLVLLAMGIAIIALAVSRFSKRLS